MLLDTTGQVRRLNPTAERMLGAAEDQAFGKRPPYTARDPRMTFPALLGRVLDGETLTDVEGTIGRKGATVAVAVSFAPVHNAVGQIDGVIGVVTDRTAAESARRALRDSEARYQRLFDRNLAGVYRTALDGGILDCNGEFARIFGYASPQDAIGRQAQELYFDVADRKALIARLRETGAFTNVEVRFRRQDGSPVWVLKSEHLVRDEHGTETLEGILSDVTEGKRMEVRLVQAERLASLAALAAGVAHEIDDPLASISANVDYVLDALDRSQPGRAEVAPAELIDALQETRQAARRVLAIVRDLGTLSRGPGAQEQQRRDSADPHAVLESVLGLLDNEIRQRARLVKDYGAAPRVAGDAVRLGQVFLNLLLNAVQAMPEGDPSGNELRIRTFTDEAGRFAVEIGDTGGGIAPEALPRIFEPFFTTKPAGLGSGLGLAICHGIVTDLGGQIAVDSQPGRGARFRVTLPPSSSGSPAAPMRPSPAPAAPRT